MLVLPLLEALLDLRHLAELGLHVRHDGTGTLQHVRCIHPGGALSKKGS